MPCMKSSLSGLEKFLVELRSRWICKSYPPPPTVAAVPTSRMRARNSRGAYTLGSINRIRSSHFKYCMIVNSMTIVRPLPIIGFPNGCVTDSIGTVDTTAEASQRTSATSIHLRPTATDNHQRSITINGQPQPTLHYESFSQLQKFRATEEGVMGLMASRETRRLAIPLYCRFLVIADNHI